MVALFVGRHTAREHASGGIDREQLVADKCPNLGQRIPHESRERRAAYVPRAVDEGFTAKEVDVDAMLAVKQLHADIRTAQV